MTPRSASNASDVLRTSIGVWSTGPAIGTAGSTADAGPTGSSNIAAPGRGSSGLASKTGIMGRSARDSASGPVRRMDARELGPEQEYLCRVVQP